MGHLLRRRRGAFVKPDEIATSVRDFYDEVGWKRAEEGASFNDAVRYEDLRQVSSRYIHECLEGAPLC